MNHTAHVRVAAPTMSATTMPRGGPLGGGAHSGSFLSMHGSVGGGGVGPGGQYPASTGAPSLPSAQSARTVSIPRHPHTGFGFSFSTHTENYLDGINHYVTSVSDGGSAMGAGK